MRIPYISIHIFIHMFESPAGNSYSLLTYNSGLISTAFHLQNFTLHIPHGNFTACYEINTQYLGITQDETMAVEILH